MTSDSPLAHVALQIRIRSVAPAVLENLKAVLAELCREQTSVGFVTSGGSISLQSESEDTLDWVIDQVRRRHGCAVTLDAPEIAFRETVAARAGSDFTQARHAGQAAFAIVRIEVEPTGRFEAPAVAFADSSGAPARFVAAALRGIGAALEAGGCAGFPCFGLRVRVLELLWNERDSTETGFAAAAEQAARMALERAGPVLLEPTLQMTIAIPPEAERLVLEDLKARRAVVDGGRRSDDAVTIEATIGVTGHFGYRAALAGLTRRQGTVSFRFAGYAPVPPFPDKDPPFASAAALRA